MADANNKIYIDIQSLLEIRQSVLVSMMGNDEAVKYIHTEDYYLRSIDEFPVDKEAYERIISSNTEDTLSHATVTYLIVVLTGRLSNMEKLNAFKDTDNTTELIVNIYPYSFNDDMVAKFKNAVFVKLGIPVKITILKEPIEIFTPSFIKHSGIGQFYCYDGGAWLNVHADAIKSGVLKDVRLFFPSLGKNKLTKEENKVLAKTGFKDIFAYTEFITSGQVKIQFLPTVFYSNLITATAVLETFNESISKMELSEMTDKET